MRKAAILVAILLWIIAAVNIFTKETVKKDEESVISAFSQNNFSTVNTTISGFAEYGKMYLSVEQKEALLGRMAKCLGITEYVTDTRLENSRMETVITAKGEGAKVTLKLVTYESIESESNINTTQYIFVDMNITDNVQSVMTYKKAIQSAYEELNADADVTLCMEGRVKGYLDYAQKNVLADAFFRNIDANVISANRENDMFTMYGFTDAIDGYITCSNEKINVNLSITYDKDSDITSVYLATPINNMEY